MLQYSSTFTRYAYAACMMHRRSHLFNDIHENCHVHTKLGGKEEEEEAVKSTQIITYIENKNTLKNRKQSINFHINLNCLFDFI